MTDEQLLLAISSMMDTKLKAELQPIKNDLQNVKGEVQNVKGEVQNIKGEVQQMKLFQENVMLPRLETIESCYIDTYNRYKNYADKMEAAFEDIELLKKVVAQLSEQMQKLA